MFYSCDGVDFGPVRAYGAIPPIGPVGPIGPSRSRSHGRLRRPKSTPSQLSVAIILLFTFFGQRYDASHLLLCDYLIVRSKAC